MKYLSILLLLLCVINTSVGQNGSFCGIDSSSIYGQQLLRLLKNSESVGHIKSTVSSAEFDIKKLCPPSYGIIDSLNLIIEDYEIENLINCENIFLNVAGFILFTKRNSKKDVVDKAIIFFKQKRGFFQDGCSDSISLMTVHDFCFDILLGENLYFKPAWKLTPKEQAKLDRKVNKFMKKSLKVFLKSPSSKT